MHLLPPIQIPYPAPCAMCPSTPTPLNRQWYKPRNHKSQLPIKKFHKNKERERSYEIPWGWGLREHQSKLSDERRATSNRAKADQRVMEQVTWLIGDIQCPNLNAMCIGLELELCWLTELRCSDAWFVCWLRCSVDIFVFRFALVISDLVIWGFWFSDLQRILGFGFFFFFF